MVTESEHSHLEKLRYVSFRGQMMAKSAFLTERDIGDW